MNKPFNMELFLEGVMTGSPATRKRHLLQAKAIQRAIKERWQLENPWPWKRKHLLWFQTLSRSKHARATAYYYSLTIEIIVKRLGKTWPVE